MVSNKYLTRVFFVMLVFICMINVSVASNQVELISPKTLPSELNEGDSINFTIRINNYNSVNAQFITIDTNLEQQAADIPIYNFGELNKYLDVNLYQQQITLNLSQIPQNYIDVSISGKVPAGEKLISAGSNITLTTFRERQQKYYEVKINDESWGMAPFLLNIKTKQDFENTMKQIEFVQLEGIKKETRELFDQGLVINAQKFADEMVKIELPNNLQLFSFISITNNFKLNLVVIITFILGLFAGAWIYKILSE